MTTPPPELTTHGQAKYEDSRVRIYFGVLDPETNIVRHICLDVTSYVWPLVRDLAIAGTEHDADNEE